MARKIEKMEIVKTEQQTSRMLCLHVHVTFNQDGVDFLKSKGHYFEKESMHMLHLMSFAKDLHEGEDEFDRNKNLAESMRAVLSDYEDMLELSNMVPSSKPEHDLLGFTLCCEEKCLKDKSDTELIEEKPKVESVSE